MGVLIVGRMADVSVNERPYGDTFTYISVCVYVGVQSVAQIYSGHLLAPLRKHVHNARYSTHRSILHQSDYTPLMTGCGSESVSQLAHSHFDAFSAQRCANADAPVYD